MTLTRTEMIPADCVCPKSGVSVKCRHHGQDLAEWGWDIDGKLVHTPLEWDEQAGDWRYRDDSGGGYREYRSYYEPEHE